MTWYQQQGKSKRWINSETNEEISYRQAINRGFTKNRVKIPVRYPGINKSHPYKTRGKWLRGHWQLVGKYSILRLSDSLLVEEIGYGRNTLHKNYFAAHDNAIKFAISNAREKNGGSEWEFVDTIWERWLRH